MTPQPSLFQREGRFLSHGLRAHSQCRRAGELLLRNDPRWTRDRSTRRFDLGKNRSITLKRPLPVHIVYDTDGRESGAWSPQRRLWA